MLDWMISEMCSVLRFDYIFYPLGAGIVSQWLHVFLRMNIDVLYIND